MPNKILASLVMLSSIAQANEIFVFSTSSDISARHVVNDGIMGEVGLPTANSKAESFNLVIDHITLK